MMLRVNDVVENTQTGERAVVRTGRGESAGKLITADYFLRAGGAVAAAHVHPHQSESFEVLDGEVEIRIGGKKILAVPGTEYVVPPGVSHRIVNHGRRDVHIASTLTPALRSDELIETLWGLATDGRTNRWGHPNPLRAAAIAAEFREEFELAWPPARVQDAIFRTLLPLARALSYRGTYVPRARRAHTGPQPSGGGRVDAGTAAGAQPTSDRE